MLDLYSYNEKRNYNPHSKEYPISTWINTIFINKPYISTTVMIHELETIADKLKWDTDKLDLGQYLGHQKVKF